MQPPNVNFHNVIAACFQYTSHTSSSIETVNMMSIIDRIRTDNRAILMTTSETITRGCIEPVIPAGRKKMHCRDNGWFPALSLSIMVLESTNFFLLRRRIGYRQVLYRIKTKIGSHRESVIH